MFDTAEILSDSVLQLDKLLELKNKQLKALKEIACTIGEVEGEDAFVLQALQVIKKVMDAHTDPFLYIRGPEGKKFCLAADCPELEEFYVYLKEVKSLDRDVIVVDTYRPIASALGKQDQGGPCIVAPIYCDNKDIGYIAIVDSTHQAVNKDERLFLRYAGETIGILLRIFQVNNDFSKIRNEMERNLNELIAVHSVSKAISGDMNVHAILDNALDTLLAQEILNVQAKCGVFLVNEATGQLDMVCHRGLDPEIAEKETSIAFGHCLCGLAAESGKIVTSDDCYTDNRHHTRYDGMLPHGHIILPLMTKGKVIGVLFLYLSVGQEATEGQVKMLKTIANQLAVAVENARLYEQVKHLSLHDSLTGLANRTLLLSRLNEEAGRARRARENLSVAMVDIDFFKKVNDTYGHAAGDMVLREVAILLRQEFRSCDFVARYGGEEFTLIMPDTNKEQAAIALERIRQSVEAFEFCCGRSDTYKNIRITISGGVAVGSGVDQSWSIETLLETADEALYKAKQTGRNKIVYAG
ncbi:MAG: sensor domain-containing diguanylate cyclase [Desulfobulbaceae bacterium]|nr:sensor domain-containing diguanylate cyclase [Desulfobulbaceae bacterium]